MSRKIGSGTLVIATHNAGKLKEISALLDPYGVKCISAGSLVLPEPAETGTSFAQNALIKARAATEASGLAALADDSGLSVAALDGRPGVYTADWAERQWFEGAPGRDWYMAMGKVEVERPQGLEPRRRIAQRDDIAQPRRRRPAGRQRHGAQSACAQQGLGLGAGERRGGAEQRAPPVDPGDLAGLQSAASRLPSSHRPRVWRTVDELPLTEAGKIDRIALRDNASAGAVL